MKVLMVPVANRPESRVAMSVAFGLAGTIDASVIGSHLRPHRDLGKEYPSRGLPLFGAPSHDALHALSKKSSAASVKAAHQLFEDVATGSGFAMAKGPRRNQSRLAVWRELVGSPETLMAIAGPLADLTIVSRPAAKGLLARTFVLAALLQSGRPVLVLPQKSAQIPGRRIAIAWNQSSEVSRTVAACMPLLAAAEQVTVISCGTEDRRGPKSSELVNYLKYWNISAKARRTKGRDEADELLQSYHDSSSDLLVMGAYSRSRVREVALGGMTEQMLWHADIPVIMQHS